MFKFLIALITPGVIRRRNIRKHEKEYFSRSEYDQFLGESFFTEYKKSLKNDSNSVIRTQVVFKWIKINPKDWGYRIAEHGGFRGVWCIIGAVVTALLSPIFWIVIFPIFLFSIFLFSI